MTEDNKKLFRNFPRMTENTEFKSTKFQEQLKRDTQWFQMTWCSRFVSSTVCVSCVSKGPGGAHFLIVTLNDFTTFWNFRN